MPATSARDAPAAEPPGGGTPRPSAPAADPSVPGPHPFPAAAFFDIDNTILRGASGYHVVRELWRHGFLGLRDIAYFTSHALRYVGAGEDARHVGPVLERALDVVRGKPVRELLALTEGVYERALASRVFPGTRDILERHLAAGHQVWLVTAGPQEVGELVAHRLRATGAVGTRAEERDGVFTGKLVGAVMHGPQKAAAAREIAVRENLDLADCFAYGDSVNDVPMLAAVGNPCAVNPEPRLRRYCQEVGWPVRDFRRRRSTVRWKAGTTATVGVASLALTVLVRAMTRRRAARVPRPDASA